MPEKTKKQDKKLEEEKAEAKKELKKEVKDKKSEEKSKLEKPSKTQKRESVKKPEETKEFVIPLRRKFSQTPKHKRTKKAVKIIREYLVRHMKVYDRDLNKIKLDKYLNEFLWHRGIKNPPFKVKVKATKNKEGIVNVELVELPDKYKFKKIRLDKRETKAKEFLDKKKSAAQRLKEAATGATTKKETLEDKTKEEKKEEDEKKAAVVEAGKQQKKAAAKQAKHQTKIKAKQPKRQQRQALQK